MKSLVYSQVPSSQTGPTIKVAPHAQERVPLFITLAKASSSPVILSEFSVTHLDFFQS